MHLTLRLLGRELLHVEVDPAVGDKAEKPSLEASGGGQFELDPFGFAVADATRGAERGTTVPRR